MPPCRLLSLLLLTGWCAAAALPARGEVFDGSFGASNGLSGNYRMIVPDGTAGPKAVGLLIFFHADGDVAAYQTHADNLAERGEQSHLAVAALSVPRIGPPDGSLPTDDADKCWWAPRQQSNAAYVDEWIQDVALPTLGAELDTARIYFAGVSGGGDFASALHLNLGFRYGGGAVALCGGDLPRQDGGSCVEDPGPDPLDPLPGLADVPQGATHAFVYSLDSTKNDPLHDLVTEARDYYRGLGFLVWFDDPPGSGHCGFQETLEKLLDRRIERIADVVPGCTPVDLTVSKDALHDDVPLEVAQQALAADDPERADLLAQIQAELDAIDALRDQLPVSVSLCSARSDCPVVPLKKTKDEIRNHLSRLKRHLVHKAIARADDPALRDSLKATNRASDLAKKQALHAIPNKGRECES